MGAWHRCRMRETHRLEGVRSVGAYRTNSCSRAAFRGADGAGALQPVWPNSQSNNEENQMTTIAVPDNSQLAADDRLCVEGLDRLFRHARTHNFWHPRGVSDELLREIYDLAKFGPTSANSSPMRIVFLKSEEAKERLRPALAPLNVEKSMAAPVVAIIAYDTEF